MTQASANFNLQSHPSIDGGLGSFLHIKFNSRDLVCDLIDKKLKLSVKADLRVRFDSGRNRQYLERLGPLASSLNEVLVRKQNDKIKAALLGYRFALYLDQNSEWIPTSYKTVDYLWSLMFVGEQELSRSYLWNDENSLNEWHPQAPMKMYLQGEF